MKIVKVSQIGVAVLAPTSNTVIPMEGEHDLQINHVAAGKFDLSIAFLEKVHNGSRTMRILREKIRFIRDLVREHIYFCVGRTATLDACRVIMPFQPPVKFVVTIVS